MRFYYFEKEYKTAKKKSLDAFFNDLGAMPVSFQFYQYCSLKNALPIVFLNGENFSVDEKIINRNMLSHGMLKRSVTKKDCLQLFLLYLNFLKYTQEYEKYIEENFVSYD